MVLSEFFWLLFALKTLFHAFLKIGSPKNGENFPHFWAGLWGSFQLTGVVSNPLLGF